MPLMGSTWEIACLSRIRDPLKLKFTSCAPASILVSCFVSKPHQVIQLAQLLRASAVDLAEGNVEFRR